MFCMHCGQELPPEACFCFRCGQKLNTASDAEGGTSSVPQPPANAPAPTPKIDCGLPLAIVAAVMGNVIGIVGLIYAVLASDLLRSGDHEGARRAAHTGKIWSWTAIILASAALFLGMLILPSMMELLFYDKFPRPAGILSHLLELIAPALKELLN